MNEMIDLSETAYTHISGSDSLPLSVVRIEPDDPRKIRCIVQIIHGKNEHKGRYVSFMKYLASHGCLTVINDLRGHGDSVLDPKDRGYLYKGCAEALVRDVRCRRYAGMRHDILHEREKQLVYRDILAFIDGQLK